MLRQLYRGQKITRQQIEKQLGKPEPKEVEVQRAEIEECQRMTRLHSVNKDIVYIDEAVFSVDLRQAKYWMHRGQPLRKHYQQAPQKPYVAVSAAVSAKHGIIDNWRLEGLDFTAESFKNFLNTDAVNDGKGQIYLLFI